MSKFVVEPNKIYDVNDGSYSFFIRVVERWYSDYKVEIACYPDLDDFSDYDLIFEPAIYTKFELKHLFGSFEFEDPESDEVEEDEEA